MSEWLAGVLENLLSKLVSSIFAKLVVWIQSRKDQSASDAAIDARLAAVKQAFQEAFDGKDVTPEQKAALKSAISNFLRGPDGGL